MKNRAVHIFIICVFVSLYVLVATTSMINSVAFFDLSHNWIMSWTLAIGFELGAAASLAAILILDKTNKFMVWGLFITLTLFQMMANTFHAYVNLENYIPWIELFGLIEEDPMTQKRILSIVSGAILPLVALGFIKSLTDYLKPKDENEIDIQEVHDNYYKERNDLFHEMTIKNAKKESKKDISEIKVKPEVIEKRVLKPEEVKKEIEEKNTKLTTPVKRVRYKP